MKYFVYDYERKGSNYYEFYKGKWDGNTFWHPESISLEDDILFECSDFEDAIISVIPTYAPFGVTEINKKQWTEIGHQITDAESKELYEEASLWLNTIWDEYRCFTILGL